MTQFPPQNIPHDDDFHALWNEAAAIWDQRESESAFEGYVSADFPKIYRTLVKLRKRNLRTFLEWGSGLGVVAIMASRLGFEAYGIEVQPELVEAARRLAKQFDSSAVFAVGSFIPEEFQADLHAGDEFHRTDSADPSAYAELDMELRDFDIVYAYPWPEEHFVFRSIMRRCGSTRALYLRYDAREGLSLSRPGLRKGSGN